jgi:hypothetical protein
VVFTELQKRLWSRGYFGYGELLAGFEHERQPGWNAVAVKLAIPFVAGFVGALSSPSDPAVVGAMAALFGSLALTWPVFLTFDAIPDYVKHRVFELRSIYALSVLAAAGLGALGGATTGLVRSLAAAPSLADWIQSVGVNLVANAIWAAGVLLVSTLIARRQAQRAFELRSEAERRWHAPIAGGGPDEDRSAANHLHDDPP